MGGGKPLTTALEHTQTNLEAGTWAVANKRVGTAGGGLIVRESSCGLRAEMPAQC